MSDKEFQAVQANDGRVYLELASGGGVLIRDIKPLPAAEPEESTRSLKAAVLVNGGTH